MLADRVKMGSCGKKEILIPCTFEYTGFIARMELYEGNNLVLNIDTKLPAKYNYDCICGVEYNYKGFSNYGHYIVNGKWYHVYDSSPIELDYMTITDIQPSIFRFIVHYLPPEGITIRAYDMD